MDASGSDLSPRGAAWNTAGDGADPEEGSTTAPAHELSLIWVDILPSKVDWCILINDSTLVALYRHVLERLGECS